MSHAIDDNKVFAILTDTTKCTSCEKCVVACKERNNLPEDQNFRWQDRVDSLSASRFTTIIHKGDHYVRQQCRHCNEPACASACIVGALKKEETGAVTYDENKCMGCRYCMMACPYGIPRYEWDKSVPLVRKCDMCHSRIVDGLQPACTTACPYGATVFGTRADMLAEAHRRLDAEPNKYYPNGKPIVWGEHEIGGVSVLYISDIDLSFLSWSPKMGDKPLPALTWQALSKVPPIVAVVAGGMGALHWIIGRRMKLAAERSPVALTAHGKEIH